MSAAIAEMGRSSLNLGFDLRLKESSVDPSWWPICEHITMLMDDISSKSLALIAQLFGMIGSIRIQVFMLSVVHFF